MSNQIINTFNSGDPWSHNRALEILDNGVPNDESSELLIRHATLFPDTITYNFENSVAIFWENMEIAAAGNFNRYRKEQNNKSGLKYPDITMILGVTSFLYNKMIDEISKGSVYEEVEVLRLVRLGSDIRDKLKIGTRTVFKKVKITFVKANSRKGLVCFMFQYNACRIETTRFNALGFPEGLNITEFSTEADSEEPI